LCTIGRICNWCTGYVAMATLWKCVAEPSGNPPGPPHACRTRTLRMPAKTRLADDKIDAPAACAVPFRQYCWGVVTRTRNVSEYMLVLALCLVDFVVVHNGSKLHTGAKSAVYSCLVTSPAGAVAKYCDEHVCLSVRPPGYLRSHTRDLYQFFCACCLWPWFGPLPAG